MPELPEEGRLKADCKKSLFLQSSQDMPPDAASTKQQQRDGRSLLLSPTTLRVVVRDGMIGSLPVPKNHRKRVKKGTNGSKAASMSQPPPQPHVEDRMPIKGAAKYHIVGDSILPKEALEAIDSDLRRLHDDVLLREKSLIASTNPGYPL